MDMRKLLISAATALVMTMTGSAARAQVALSTYADAEGFIDVQALTCAELANTWQEDADRLAAWYSGWYNGLAKKHYIDAVVVGSVVKGVSETEKKAVTA